eukprot:1623733-Rhodomonas_salina.2
MDETSGRKSVLDGSGEERGRAGPKNHPTVRNHPPFLALPQPTPSHFSSFASHLHEPDDSHLLISSPGNDSAHSHHHRDE